MFQIISALIIILITATSYCNGEWCDPNCSNMINSRVIVAAHTLEKCNLVRNRMNLVMDNIMFKHPRCRQFCCNNVGYWTPPQAMHFKDCMIDIFNKMSDDYDKYGWMLSISDGILTNSYEIMSSFC